VEVVVVTLAAAVEQVDFYLLPVNYLQQQPITSQSVAVVQETQTQQQAQTCLAQMELIHSSVH
jgi:hypothetical protein